MTEEEDLLKKFICPICKKSFTTRALAKTHMNKEGHQGGIVVDISDPIRYVPKKYKKKKGKNWRCPVCNKNFKSKKAAKQHMVSMKHLGKPNEIKEEKPKEEEKVDRPVTMWCRLSEPHWLQIKDTEPVRTMVLKGIGCPATGNYLIQYDTKEEHILDYLMFIYDFVEIEMELEDVLFVLSQMSPDIVLEVKDIATLMVVPIHEVSVEGCILIHPESETSPSVEVLSELLSPFSERNLACIGGIWEKKKPAVKSTGSRDIWGGHSGPQSRREDVGGYWYASEEEEPIIRPETNLLPYKGRAGGGSLVPPKREPITPPTKPVEEKKEDNSLLKFHPVYKISEKYIYTDRVIDYDIYVE